MLYGLFGQIVDNFGRSHAERSRANNQMLSLCNSAPLFLLARTPCLEEEGQPGSR